MTTKRKSNTLKPRRIVLYCSHGGGCPTVTLRKTEVVITDDYGGKVSISRNQFRQLQEI